MATFEFSARRLILAGGFAVASAAAPALAVLAMSAAPAASLADDCVGGEEADQFTGVCVPHTVPNSPSPFQSIPGNPDLPAVDGIPCTGANSGQCIGLAEEAQSEGPMVSPESTVSSSPTITGGV